MDRTEQALRVFCANLRFRANDARASYMAAEAHSPAEDSWFDRWQTLDTIASELEAALGIRSTSTFEERAERSL